MNRIFNVFRPLTLFFVLLSSTPLFAFQNEPDGFRGIKWGSETEKQKDLQHLVRDRNDVKAYQRTNEKLKIGDVTIKEINYFFYKNKFYKSVVYYTDTDSSELERNLSSVYGSGKREYIISPRDAERAGKSSLSSYWYGNKVDIKLIRQTRMGSYNPDEPDCDGETIEPVTFFSCLSYTYKPIDKQKQIEERIMQEKERKKFLSEKRKEEQQLRKNVEKDL